MQTIKKNLSSLAIALSVGACGGGGTGVSDQASFETLNVSAQGLLERHKSLSVTDIANMPDSGIATYRGVAAYSSEYSDIDRIIKYAGTLSDLELSADFARSTLSGRVFNFKNFDATTTVNGHLEVNGTISGNSFSASIAGETLEIYHGDSVTVSYSGNVSGDFIDSNAESLRGSGSLTGDAGSQGTDNVWMAFSADRN